MPAVLQRLNASDDPNRILEVILEDGGVIVEDLLSADVVAQVNADVEDAVAAADPSADMFNPIMQAFHGAQTKQISGMPGRSKAFAVDVMCHPLYMTLAQEILGPNCAKFQLNLGHLLQRGPGSEEQLLHRDEAVWSDVPFPHPELQLASVIAFVDFTRENGATRVVPGSHKWPERELPLTEQFLGRQPTSDEIAYAEMTAGSAVIYLGGTIHGGGANVTDIPRRGAHLSYCLGWLRTEENNYLSCPPDKARELPRLAQEVLGYSVQDNLPRGGAYLGMLDMQDPVELLQSGKL